MSSLARTAIDLAISAQQQISDIYNSNFIPNTDGTINIGNETNRFNNLYLSNNAVINGYIMTNAITTPQNSDLDIIPDTGSTRIQSQLTYRTNIVNVTGSMAPTIAQSNSIFLLSDINESITINTMSHNLDSLTNGTILKFLIGPNVGSDVDEVILTFAPLTVCDRFRGKFISPTLAIYLDDMDVISFTIDTNGLKEGDTIELIYIGNNIWMINANIYDASAVRPTTS